MGDDPLQPLQPGLHPHLLVGREVKAGMHDDPFCAELGRDVDIGFEIAIDRRTDMGRVLGDVDRRRYVQAEMNAVPLAGGSSPLFSNGGQFSRGNGAACGGSASGGGWLWLEACGCNFCESCWTRRSGAGSGDILRRFSGLSGGHGGERGVRGAVLGLIEKGRGHGQLDTAHAGAHQRPDL